MNDNTKAGLLCVQEADCVPHVHPAYGSGLFFTEDAIIGQPATKAAPQGVASLANDIKEGIEELSEGRHYPDLLEAVDRLAILAQTEQAALSMGAAPGWRLVPVEPTEAMKSAAVRYANGDAVYKNVGAEVLRIEEGIYGEVYEAMLAAAPQTPKDGGAK